MSLAGAVSRDPAVSASRMDPVRPNLNPLDLSFLLLALELGSNSADEANDTSDLDGYVGMGFCTGCSGTEYSAEVIRVNGAYNKKKAAKADESRMT